MRDKKHMAWLVFIHANRKIGLDCHPRRFFVPEKLAFEKTLCNDLVECYFYDRLIRDAFAFTCHAFPPLAGRTSELGLEVPRPSDSSRESVVRDRALGAPARNLQYLLMRNESLPVSRLNFQAPS